jgi:putative ABC transport system substrate-binding protein
VVTRRAFLGTLAGGLLTAPLVAEAQQAERVYRIGFLSGQSPTDLARQLETFRQRLRELGYVEGRNVAIEYRFAEGRPERPPAFAAELVRLKVDIIVTAGPPAPMAA